jgi:hypothetical protein
MFALLIPKLQFNNKHALFPQGLSNGTKGKVKGFLIWEGYMVWSFKKIILPIYIYIYKRHPHPPFLVDEAIYGVCKNTTYSLTMLPMK